jgi:glycosyltransferase involved in cell wall biosynthesis
VSEPAPLLVFADDWGRHPSSCQHLVRRLRADRPVVWVNTIGTRQVKADGVTLRRGFEKLRNWARGVTRVADQMWVVDLPMVPGLRGDVLRGFNRAVVQARLRQVLARLGVSRPVVLTTLPYVGWLAGGISRRGLIYYCTDDYSYWPSADRDTLQAAERDLLADCDLALAASRALADRLRYQTRRCEYFPHGVDFAHFASARHRTPEPAVAQLPGPRVGFFGLIYEKLDFSTLAAVARRFSDGTLAMIGPVDRCPAEFAALPNVRLLGPRPYADLPAAVAGLDVLLLPYVDDAMIRQSGPLKLRECLATGLPTVSVDVPEVRALRPHVRVAATAEAFVGEVAAALREPRDSGAAAARQEAVRDDGWDRRADTLRDYLTPFERPSTGVRVRQRVLHLRTVSGKGGGPEKTLLNNPRFLNDDYDVRLAYVRPEVDAEYDMPRRAEAVGVHLTDVPERSGTDPRTVWRLAREIARFRPHLLHAHDYKTNLLGVILARFFRIPVVTTLHGYVTRGGRLELYYLADRLALPLMDHVVSVSPDLDRQAGAVRVPASRRSMLENGIDTDDFRRGADVAAAKCRLGLRPEQAVIGAVGRLAPEKGFDVLIRATASLVAKGTDVVLLIAGTGDESDRLRVLAEELGVPDRVRLLGHVGDPRSLFEAMDVFVLSSYREGLPNVLLEAMALEVPVVATRVNGVPRLVRDGENGVLVEAGAPDQLAEAMARMLGDRATRDRLARSGRATVVEGYSFDRRMAKMRRVYERVLGRRRGPQRRVS